MYQQTRNPPTYPSHSSSLLNNEMGRFENMFKQMIEKNADLDVQLASHNTSIHNLEVQIGQMSQALNSRPNGALPSDTVVNQKGDNNTAHAMAVIIRSGRGGNAPTLSESDLLMIANVEETQEEVNPSREHIINIPEPVVQKAKAPLLKPPHPYPQILSKQNGENQFKKFIQIMKSVSINVPLVEALEQIPGYAKFMKDLVTMKRSMNFDTIKVTH
ncbi:uncharacterized protein [Nicotiana sylvestris]|uniref:uncharacterized protein n=1 Tax=Nicotiana sylvestris TaxID=4096 RepID=UPI00388CCB26